MGDLTSKFAALEEQLEAADAAMQVDLNAMREQLDLINAQLDTQTINNAANTKAILAALGQSAACFPCPTPSIVVPPISTLPIGINEDHCKRAQAFIKTVHDILSAMDTMQSFNVIGTYNVIADAISQVVSAVAAGDTLPLPSFPEGVQIAGTYVSYAGERLFSGVGLLEQFEPLEDDLRDATYLAGTPEAARAGYEGVIDGSSVSTAAGFLFKAVAYTALYSYFFDDTSLPDLSGFEGDVCGAPSECVTLLEDHSFVITKTNDDGLDYVQFEIPSWAVSVEWNITFSEGFNVFWSATARETGDPFTGFINSTGFDGTETDLWTDAHSGTTYFGVGGFFAGFPNGHTVNVTINSLIVCPGV